jgi:hypothetical protein
MGASAIVLILAVIAFAIPAFGIDIDIGGVNLFALGMALFAASFLLP